MPTLATALPRFAACLDILSPLRVACTPSPGMAALLTRFSCFVPFPLPPLFWLFLQGFTLTCQTYPCGPGLKILLNQYDTVYEMQYGQFEVKAEKKKKMFGMF